MRRITLFVFAIAGLLSFTIQGPGLALGDEAPLQDRVMKDISGKSLSLSDLKKENGLLVIFSCNTCPFVLGWESNYPVLGDLSDRLDIGMVLVNSNEAFRSDQDSFDAMVDHAKKAGYNTPYVVDADHKLADAFDANTTPHVFLFDNEMKLVFKGSINDKYENKDKKATQDWLIAALRQLAAGHPENIDPAETRNIGCSIKRVKI